MFPFITLRGIKIYMTGLGIVIGLITFIAISRYLCKRYSIQFWRLFYRLPWAIVLMYLFGSYVDFALRVGIFPTTRAELVSIISPYGYNLHFVGILLGIAIALGLFFKKIKRIENKKMYSDVFFFGITGAMIPLGLFLLLGDDFIGRSTSSIRGVQALHTQSSINKFTGVYPIGLALSIGSALLFIAGAIRKKIQNQTGIGLIGLAYLLIFINIIILYQQYPRYGIMPFGDYTIDIKQYVSIIICFLIVFKYKKRKTIKH